MDKEYKLPNNWFLWIQYEDNWWNTLIPFAGWSFINKNDYCFHLFGFWVSLYKDDEHGDD